MKNVSKACTWTAIILLLAGVGTYAKSPQTGHDDLYEGFQNPPKEYDIIPLWTWNGRIDAQEGKRQIDEMLAQGVKRVIVYPFPNLRVRFLSDDWWKLWGELLAYAHEKGFQMGVNAENTWPDGDARDQWLDPPDQSHVLEGHREYHMKRLAYVEREFVGPGRVRFDNLPNPVIAIAAPIKGPNAIDGERLIDLSSGISTSTFSGEVPVGDWRMMFFYLENTVGAAQGIRIDPLNPAAVGRFIDLTLGEYYRRFQKYFGNTFSFVLVDNEGDYGDHIGWTPALFDVFRAEKGYDLRKYLPLLVYEGGKQTPKVRVDYLRVISDLYQKNYWGQIARWCEQHGLEMTAQGWSESLQFDASYGGDYMQMMRALTFPGVEALGNRGRSPREFVENQSIADFERKRYWCEGPLVLGSQTYLTPQMERYATNMLGVWGIDLWSPQFYMDKDSLSFPPDVFISQPWWKYFRHYTDYLRRIGYMNGGGRHVVDLLLYRPMDTTFAYSDPLFNNKQDGELNLKPDSTATPTSSTSMSQDSGYESGPFGSDYYPRIIWNTNFAATVETAYFDLMELLTGYQRAYDVVDDYYLERMELEHGSLKIADLSFKGITLPPMRVMSRKALSRIRDFFDEGGLVVAYGTLPSASSEEGWGDPVIASDIKAIFGVEPGWTKDAENQNAQGGKAYFVVGNVQKVLDALDRSHRADLEVVQGPRERLIYLHRTKEGRDLYWIVNDTDRPRHATVSLAAQGKTELWDPATGKSREVASWTQQGHTVIPLDFNAWDATYVVFNPKDSTASNTSVSQTNLLDYAIQKGPHGEVEVRGRVAASAEKIYLEGEEGGKPFRIEEPNAKRVEPQVLSSEGWRFSVEEKQVEVKYAREKLVPRGEGLAEGFAEPGYNDQTWNFPSLSPEKETIRDWWVMGPFANPNYGEGFNTVYPPEEKIDLDATYTDANGAEVGWRRFHSVRPEIDLTEAIGSAVNDRTLGYAATWVHAPRDEEVTSLIVGENIKLWINGELIFGRYTNPQYFELRDSFGYERRVHLKAGWNQILVKAVPSHRNGRALFFYLRFTDGQGAPAKGLIAAWRPSDDEASRKTNEAKVEDEKLERWYRVEVPAGTRALLLPQRTALEAAYLNGKKINPNNGRIQFPQLDFSRRPVLALKMSGGSKLDEFLRFESGETGYHLGSWTGTGLSYYSGSAAYERDFELAPQPPRSQILLDCGEVGAVAEVFLNGQKVGTRLWKPFSFDLTKFLEPGKNHLRIVVTNESDAAVRAVPDFKRYLEMQDQAKGFLLYGPAPYMDVIDLNGLIGPVQLVPYRDVKLSTRARK